MIRMIQSTSAAQAKEYFSEALAQTDYYLNDQELAGNFHGKIAVQLGITGKATKDVFHALCENQHPVTGEALTPRKKDNRTTGYDINFHCPKSVSLLHVLVDDGHILNAFDESVQETMWDIESDAQTRVRKNNADENRQTGTLLWADFIHQTARPVSGFLPDPHLHSHCFVFNVTWDDIEQRFKAAQFRDIKRDMPYYQALFHKRLADKLVQLGYRIRRRKVGFDVEGIPPAALALFSKRTDEIGRMAKEQGITDAKALDKLGGLTRAKKQKGLTLVDLKQNWRKQIVEADTVQKDNAILRMKGQNQGNPLSPKDCLDFTLSHCFERASVVAARRLLEAALRFGIDGDCSINSITDCFAHDNRLVKLNDGDAILYTTTEILAQEQRLIKLANKGKDCFAPFYATKPGFELTGDQAVASAHVLTTKNQTVVIHGRAGTGKTTLMTETIRLIEATGAKVTVVAPTAEAARGVLRDEGFDNADTVASLLTDTIRRDELKGQVLWVDEAGLLGLTDMLALFELVTAQNARLILSGDTRQHSSVVRGDALRMLESLAGVEFIGVNRIYRQKSEQYKAAVSALAMGDAQTAFEQLDKMDAVHSMNPMLPYKELVECYMATIKKRQSALVIAPTHCQGVAVTESIRAALRRCQRIGDTDIELMRLVNLSLTVAEKQDFSQFKPGDVIQFSQHAKGIKKGSRWVVKETKHNALRIENSEGETKTIHLNNGYSFEVYQQKKIALAKHDSIRITRNGFDSTGRRMNNGQILEVVTIDKKDQVILRNKTSKAIYTVPLDFGHWAHAYCITSHASQGKTVDVVFIAQPAATFPATDLKQFYVSVSRGRYAVHIFTDDKEALLHHASQIRNRTSALELLWRQNETSISFHHNPIAPTHYQQRNSNSPV
jgi:conjugative relaxase-like TrwC/TraI family protein